MHMHCISKRISAMSFSGVLARKPTGHLDFRQTTLAQLAVPPAGPSNLLNYRSKVELPSLPGVNLQCGVGIEQFFGPGLIIRKLI